VFAYVPQLIKIGRDTEGAVAISYATWGMFTLSHLSTVAYALVAVNDWKMAGVFAANTLCCSAILALTAYKRKRTESVQRHRPTSNRARWLGLASRLATPNARLGVLRVFATLATTVAVL
jgi:hypothetical protein